jgi:hypothetical protein
MVSGFCWLLPLAGELMQALTSGWKFSLLDDQNGKAILDRELKLAALADETFAFQMEARPAGVHGAAKDFE